MHVWVIYKYIILICDLCTMKFSLKMVQKQTQKSSRKYKISRKSYILVACLKRAASVKKAGSISENILKVLRFDAYTVSKNYLLAVTVDH